MLGLHCRLGISLAAVGEGSSPAAACGPLSAGLLVADGWLQGHGLQAFRRWAPWSWLLGSRAQTHRLWWWAYLPPGHVGSYWIRDWAHVSCTGRRIPPRWATREAPLHFCFSDCLRGMGSGVDCRYTNYGMPASTIFAIQCLLYLFIHFFLLHSFEFFLKNHF